MFTRFSTILLLLLLVDGHDAALKENKEKHRELKGRSKRSKSSEGSVSYLVRSDEGDPLYMYQCVADKEKGLFDILPALEWLGRSEEDPSYKDNFSEDDIESILAPIVEYFNDDAPPNDQTKATTSSVLELFPGGASDDSTRRLDGGVSPRALISTECTAALVEFIGGIVAAFARMLGFAAGSSEVGKYSAEKFISRGSESIGKIVEILDSDKSNARKAWEALKTVVTTVGIGDLVKQIFSHLKWWQTMLGFAELVAKIGLLFATDGSATILEVFDVLGGIYDFGSVSVQVIQGCA